MPPAPTLPARPLVLITDADFPHLDEERRIFAAAGLDFKVAACRTPAEVISAGAAAAALLVNRAPIDRAALRALPHCRVVVRYGIGVDNVDLAAAAECGIAVANVPDYATGEVADHTVALALSLARQIPAIDRRLRSGVWKIVPDRPMPSFRDLTFVTVGHGRIARQVLARARAFGFRLGAHDPWVPAAELRAAGTEPLGFDAALATADILSLHLPLSPSTRHLIGRESLSMMKASALLINTARGGLIDTAALAQALHSDALAGAALDVFADEPLAADDPIRNAPRTVLTSHVAWYSDASLVRLQRLAAEEVVRGVRGEPLRSPVTSIPCSTSTAKSP